ncbi:hypothetical protein BD309DRAFT_973980 [Dichomitus squalens]|nr:hypothetical protein BD309DRAFT_973980 [Dichomitus squalens]
MPTLSITYDLNPPSDTTAPAGLTPKTTLQYPVSENADSQKAYYEGLRAAVLQAKSSLGEQLTAWRDVVGKREDQKEATIPKKNEDEDEEQEEPEEP